MTDGARKPYIRLGPDARAAVVREYLDGEKVELIAMRHKIGAGTVCRIVDVAGAARRRKSRQKPRRGA